MAKPNPRRLSDPPTTAGSIAPRRSRAGRRRPDQGRVAERLGCRDEQEALSVVRSGPQTPPKALLDPSRERRRIRQPEPAGEAAGVQASRQLQQGEWVAARLGDDPLAYRLVDRAEGRRGEERVRVGVGERASRRSSSPRARPVSSVSRTAKTISTPSASSRRATNDSTCADVWSSHCASSTRQTSGGVSAASESSVRTASPTRKRSGRSPAPRPNAVRSASLLRRRQPLETVEERRAELVQARRTGAPSPTRRPRRARRAARRVRQRRRRAGRSCRFRPRRAGRTRRWSPRGPRDQCR